MSPVTKEQGCRENYISLFENGFIQMDVDQTEQVSDSQVEQNVEFIEDNPVDKISFPTLLDDTYTQDVQPDVNLAQFLERPIDALSVEWDAGGFTTTTFKPWELFFDNAAVKNKIANFSYISCELNVEFRINSTPFNYGSMICAYHPLPKFSPNTLSVPNQLDRVCKSQRPHVWLYPQTNAGGVMRLPFFYFKNFLTLSSREELQDMGEIDLIEYVPLRAANGVVNSPVTIQVFIWATNVSLTGGTVAGVLQSAKDEYDVEPISRPASAIADAASYLTSVPIIGPFAKATEIGASAVSSVAKLFGYTDVPVISNSSPYKSLPFNGLSSAEISQPKDKFTLDPKAELTIDPQTVGLGNEDEMSIPYIVQKESFLTAYEWNISSAPNELLFNMSVTPTLREISAVSNGSEICYTPMSHCAQLFNNWRGDIIVRFKFISTVYHRGRIRFSWDPVGDLVSNPDTMNIVFTKVVDLAVDSNVEFRIPYMQAKMWQQTRSVQAPDHPKDWQISGFTNLSNQTFGNGTLTARVLTKLSAPAVDANISVMVFVRGAENLELANPVTLSDQLSNFNIQSASDEVEIVDIGNVGKVASTRYLINYGEAVCSLRTLLRRSVLADIIPLEPISDGNNSAYVIVNYSMNKYPIPPGFNPDVTTRASTSIFTSEPYAFTHMTPFNWMQSAYVACRGSMQWDFNMNANGSSPVESIKLVRSLDLLPAEVLDSFNSANGANLNSYSSFFINNTTAGVSGLSLTNQRVQPGVSVELNQFNQNRFVSSSNFNTTRGLGLDNTDRETYKFQMFFANQGRNDIAGTLIERYSSIGTDFNFFFYLNAPITYYLDEVVTPN